MNAKWQKRRRLPDKEPVAVYCSGPELALVLAKLRRLRLSHSEPVLEPDSRTAEVLSNGQVRVEGEKRERRYLILVHGGGEDCEPVGEDRVHYFRSFDAGTRGEIGLSW
jgi:hypothetical protein